jgi:hypothetical protein
LITRALLSERGRGGAQEKASKQATRSLMSVHKNPAEG